MVGAALEFYEENKLLQNSSLPLALEKDKDSRLLASPLKFPGKLAIDVLNNRLFISDSNHNRIVSILCFAQRYSIALTRLIYFTCMIYFLSDLAVCSILISVIKVVTNLEGEFICQIGSSEEGLLDGTFDTASFNRPQVRK